MNYVILKVITFLHILFVLFVIISPFINRNYILFLHSFVVPFMIFHWILNNNACGLTIIERILRKQISKSKNVNDDCITCKLIEPVYDFRKNYIGFTVIIYTVTILLWLLSVLRLYWRYNDGKIRSWEDLFIVDNIS